MGGGPWLGPGRGGWAQAGARCGTRASGPLAGANLGALAWIYSCFSCTPTTAPLRFWHYSVLCVHYSWIRRCAVPYRRRTDSAGQSRSPVQYLARFAVSDGTDSGQSHLAPSPRLDPVPIPRASTAIAGDRGDGLHGQDGSTRSLTWTFHACTSGRANVLACICAAQRRQPEQARSTIHPHPAAHPRSHLIARTGGLLPASWLVSARVEALRQGPRLQALPRHRPANPNPGRVERRFRAAPGSQSWPLEPAAPAMPPHGSRATAPARRVSGLQTARAVLEYAGREGTLTRGRLVEGMAGGLRASPLKGGLGLAIGRLLPSCRPPKIPCAGVRLPFSWTRRPGVEMKSRAAPDNAFSGPVSLQYCNITRFPLWRRDPPCRTPVRATTEHVHTGTSATWCQSEPGARAQPCLSRSLSPLTLLPPDHRARAPPQTCFFRPGAGPC